MIRIKGTFKLIRAFLVRHFTVYSAAFLLIIIALAIWYFTQVTLDEIWPNIIPELLSIALTVFIIDALNRQHSDKELKKVLIKQLGSRNNAVASEALKELDARGWLSDGTLKDADIQSANLDSNSFDWADMRGIHLSFSSLQNTTWLEANLEGALLDYADLQGATLSMPLEDSHFIEANLKNAMLCNANLYKAQVRDKQLAQAKSLWRAKMPDGSTYDGRYNFQFDINAARKSVKNRDDASEIAAFYGVTVEDYLKGQQWTSEKFDDRS